MRALSIRQPFAELILRGMKRCEFRSRPTRIVGERFYIYAAKGARAASRGATSPGIWSRDLAVSDTPLKPWMVELAEGLRLWQPGELPTGVIVGSAMIEKVEARADGYFAWHLMGVERLTETMKPARHPQPVWFAPF